MKRAQQLVSKLLSGVALASALVFPSDSYAEERTYTVVPGDTLYALSKKLGVSLEHLVAQNTGITPTQLQVGQTLKYDTAPVVHESSLSSTNELVINTRNSPNYSPGRKKAIEGIVIHSTEGSGTGALHWLCNPVSKASAHYLIAEDGTVTQLVKDSDTAWHVGRNANSKYIGIEFAGFAHKPGQQFTQKQYESGALLVGSLMKQHTIPRDKVVSHAYVTKHLGGTDHTDPGVNFKWDEFNAQLHKATNSVVRVRKQ